MLAEPCRRSSVGDAARKRLVERLVAVVEGINHHHAGRNRTGGFIDIVAESRVRVRIDNAGRDVLSCSVDYLCVLRRTDSWAITGDLPCVQPYAGVLQRTVSDGHNGCVTNHNIFCDGGSLAI